MCKAYNNEDYMYEKMEQSEEETSAEESYDSSDENDSVMTANGTRRSGKTRNPPNRGLMVAYVA